MKNTNMKTTLLCAVALSSALFASASNAESGWYLGGSISQSYIDEPGIDENDTGGKLYGGYKFNRFFAVEGSYYDFGDLTENGNSLEIDGGSLGLVGTYPIAGGISLRGTVGIHSWDADVSGPILNRIGDNSDEDAFYGLGLDYALTDSLTLRGSVERYEVDNVDLDVGSIGVSFNF